MAADLVTNSKKLEYLLEVLAGNTWLEYWKKNPELVFKEFLDQKLAEYKIINTFVKFGPDSVVLDYGIGMGLIAEHVCRSAGKVYGWDIDPAMLEYCKDKFSDTNNIELLHPNFPVDSLKYSQINTIMVNNVIGEYFDLEKFGKLLSQFSNILGSGGKVWFDWYNINQKIKTLPTNHPIDFKTPEMTHFTPQQVLGKVKDNGNFDVVFLDEKYHHAKTLIKKI
jgi:ubiquinone/menaquinone biosynthesis C-methylase UbiE